MSQSFTRGSLLLRLQSHINILYSALSKLNQGSSLVLRIQFFILLYQNSITDRLSSSAYNSLFCFIKTQSRIVSRPPHTRNLSSKYQGQGSKPPINQTLSPDTRLKSQTSNLLEPFSKNQDRDIQTSIYQNRTQRTRLKSPNSKQPELQTTNFLKATEKEYSTDTPLFFFSGGGSRDLQPLSYWNFLTNSFR